MPTYNVNFGIDKKDLTTVAYSFLDGDGAVIIPAKTVGVVEIADGVYQVTAGRPNQAATILWTTGEVTPAYASESIATPDLQQSHVAGGPNLPWQGNAGLSGGAGAGRTFLQTGNSLIGVRFTGEVTRFLTTRRSGITTGEFKLLIFRGGTRIYASPRYFLHGSYTNASLSDVLEFALDRPLAVRTGDKIGIWVPATVGADAISCRTLSAVGSVKWAEGDITSEASLSSTIPLTELNIQLLSDPPVLVVTGDSIAEGHGGNTKYHGRYHTSETLGGELSSELGYWVAKYMGNVSYENHALGSQTFAWVASTGIVSAVAANPEYILIHCGVNDVVTGRTWAAVEANLNTIRATVPLTTVLAIDEILPWTAGTDAQSLTIRTWNSYLATWCRDNGVLLNKCHDILGQIRESTGELDDLLAAYDQDEVHTTASGTSRLGRAAASTILTQPDATVNAVNASATGINAATAATEIGKVQRSASPVAAGGPVRKTNQRAQYVEESMTTVEE
ncbi:SGNH/GDSL hydrolase family protein [Aureliella helgolandensis]|uniref:SGNH hydrolase-type esterase domain-containing protein n=1 Tax=Aureliella helgolandensis TaxID=2527968 RepID=A0A518GEE3_9BACT|nr:SGNH/GDSL hydrolase family protein [Aureliella helgolandensis]QDV26918.1 hypothetical protein Q31a_52980 [Aureliella helgolandensis]